MAGTTGKQGQPIPPLSPCIRHCCLDDNDICIGCYRSLTEILKWSGASDETKLNILELVSDRKAVRRQIKK